jgi:hypothetical protein
VPLPPGAAEALAKIFEHNDACARSGVGRVSQDAAVKMLNEHYGWVGGVHALGSICQRAFGRRSWSTK